MHRSSYGERDYAFAQRLLTLRTKLGLTQAELGRRLQVSARAVGEWESGSSSPKPDRLKEFIALALRASAFAAGREEEEIRALWKAAHQKVLLDEPWLASLLGHPQSHLQLLPPTPAVSAEPVIASPEALGPLLDRGEALEVPSFYGREAELATLVRWVLEEGCRMVSVLGLGGIGKSALVVRAMDALASHFQVVLFRSLRDAPSCQTVLESCLQVLCPEALPQVQESLSACLDLLLAQLRSRRVLLVLDNLESLLQTGEGRGQLRPGYQDYGRLLQRVAQTAHQSGLLLTSRERPAVLRGLEGSQRPVRALHLSGLSVVAGEQLLAQHELVGSPQERVRLVQAYAGNPLALNIVAQTIADLFGGELAAFLQEDTLVFGSISDLLSEHWGRLSALEQTLLFWLAILREPVTIDDLLTVLVAPLTRMQLLEAVEGLRQRSLLERGQRAGSFTLLSVVLEYVTDRLVRTAREELEQGQLRLLREHGLSQAQAKEYVRQTQERLLLVPVLASLQSVNQGRAEVEQHLRSLLTEVRSWAEERQGYAPANLVTLLRLLRGDLQGLDLSYLSLRGLSLQGVEMQDSSLAGATLRESTLTEAFDALWAVAISQNGQYWAAGSMQGKVHVWLKGGQTLHLAWQAHTDTIIALAFSPDGRQLASGSWDGSIKLWELESGTLLWSGWHSRSVNGLAFAPDGGWLASSGNDAVVRLWDPQSGKQVQTLPHPAPVYAITWSPDGRLLASGDFQGEIRLWQMQQTQPATCLQTLFGHSNWVTGLAFAPNGAILASANWDGTVKLWEVGEEGSHRLLQTLSGHTDQVNRVSWSPDGRTLASCGYDKTIWLWDVEQGRYRVVLSGHTATVWGLAFTPEDGRLLSCSEDGTLRVWEVASGQCVHVLQGYAIRFYDIAWSPDSTHLVSVSKDGLVIVWDVTAQRPQRVLGGHSWVAYGVAWSPDGRLVASSGWDTFIRLWDPSSGACVQTLQDPDDPDTLFYSVAWSPDGHLLACGTYQRGVQVWDVTARTRRWVGRMDPIWIYHVAWSPDGARLASTTDDGRVHLWNASDGLPLRQLAGHHHGIVGHIEWSPDGSRLASCAGEEGRGRGEVFVWDVESGERVRAFVGDPGVIYAVAWDATGDLLVSGDGDGRLRWWDVPSGECVRMREGHQGRILSLRRSPDGRWLASCGDDGAIRIWDMHSGELLHTLRRDRPYERLDITGIRGLTEAQKAMLRALGAREEARPSL